MSITRLIHVLALAAAIIVTTPGAPARAEEKKVLIIFTPEAEVANKAGKLADGIWRKVESNQKGEFVMVDIPTVQGIEEGLDGGGIKWNTPIADVVHVLKEKFQANVGVWGQLRDLGGRRYELKLRGIDLTASPDKYWIDETISAEGERHLAVMVDRAAELILGKPTWKPAMAPAPNEAEPPETGPLVIKNAGFEDGKGDQPADWERTDGLATFWVDLGEKRGKGLRIDTAITEAEYLAWRKKSLAGAPASQAPKKSKNDTSYSCIGGTYGIHYFSDLIPMKEGMQYRISADCKAKSDNLFFPKIFIRCYSKQTDKFNKTDATAKPANPRAALPDETDGDWRTVYDTYLACQNGTGEWMHYWMRFDPWRPKGKAPVEKLIRPTHMRVCIYCYWPPEEYFFDNVRLTEDPQPTKAD